MNKTTKILLFGFLTWLMPFLVSFFFVDQNGNYLISEKFFKTIMIVTGALVGSILAVKYFDSVKSGHVREGIVIGVSWLAMNWALDLAMVLGGFFRMTVPDYFADIGLRYLSIPIFTIAMAYALKNKK